MSEKTPQSLTTMSDVAQYWRSCLNELEQGIDDSIVAGHMVGIISNDNDENWSSGTDAHPAYPIIFELAASLEIPSNITKKRNEHWECVRALVSVLEKRYIH